MKNSTELDRIDLRILSCLQEDATQSIAEIARHCGISSSPCWRRIQRLEREGVIKRRVALIDQDKVDLALTVFINIRTGVHSTEWLQKFCALVSAIPEVVEFYRMSGNVDYLLRVVVPDIAAFDQVYKRLIDVATLNEVTSHFAMERIKYSTALPLRGT